MKLTQRTPNPLTYRKLEKKDELLEFESALELT